MLSLVKNILILLFLFAQMSSLNADDNIKTYTQQGEEFAQKMLSKSKIDLEKTFSEAKDLEILLNKTPIDDGKGCKDCGTSILTQTQDDVDMYNHRLSGGTSASDSSVTLVFVSFSMPDIAIKELCDNAARYGATIVLIGLHEDSFIATKDKILEINPDGISLSIHPDLFKQYDIKRVPTFVLVKDGQEVARLSGNVTLEFAVSKLEER